MTRRPTLLRTFAIYAGLVLVLVAARALLFRLVVVRHCEDACAAAGLARIVPRVRGGPPPTCVCGDGQRFATTLPDLVPLYAVLVTLAIAGVAWLVVRRRAGSKGG